MKNILSKSSNVQDELWFLGANSSNCDKTLFDWCRFKACTFCLDFVCIYWTHQNVRRLKRTDLGGHFCRLKAIRFRGRLSQWVEAEFYPPAFSRDFSLEFQIVTFRNCTKKFLWKHRCMKIKCSFRNYLNPLWFQSSTYHSIIQYWRRLFNLFIAQKQYFVTLSSSKICIVESSSTILNKNKIFWPFVTRRMNMMLWLIQKTSTLAKRKFSWWAKKRWILHSQFRGGRGKSYLFDIYFRKSKGPNKKFLILWDFNLKE